MDGRAHVPKLVSVAGDIDVWPAVKEKGPHLCGPFMVELPGIEPSLYQDFWRLNSRFVPPRSGSVPLATCGCAVGS